jgi:hypothetical protein
VNSAALVNPFPGLASASAAFCWLAAGLLLVVALAVLLLIF